MGKEAYLRVIEKMNPVCFFLMERGSFGCVAARMIADNLIGVTARLINYMPHF